MKFAFRIKAIHKGGTLKAENDRIIVKDADEVVFLLTADTDYKMNFAPDFKDPKAYVGNDPSQTTLAMMNNVLKKVMTSFIVITKPIIPHCSIGYVLKLIRKSAVPICRPTNDWLTIRKVRRTISSNNYTISSDVTCS